MIYQLTFIHKITGVVSEHLFIDHKEAKKAYKEIKNLIGTYMEKDTSMPNGVHATLEFESWKGPFTIVPAFYSGVTLTDFEGNVKAGIELDKIRKKLIGTDDVGFKT
jgi:hypothetical protein